MLKARYFDGSSSLVRDVEVSRIDGTSIRVSGGGIDRIDAVAGLRLTPRLGRTLRTLEFPDGARALITDHQEIDAWFPSEDRLQKVVDRLERHAYAVAGSILICLAAGFVTFTWGVPWMSDRIAAEVPASIEGALGREVLSQLDRFFGFAKSEINEQRQHELTTRFNRLTSGLPDGPRYQLVYRNAPAVGPNAFALPGGSVVVTDQLVSLLPDDREFDAIVAHELGHQQHRHALRQTLRSSFVLVVAALFTGDVSSASTIVVAIPTFLLQSHYSRGFEDEADHFAFTNLAAQEVSPSWFAAAMRELDEYYDVDDDGGMAYLSSHPDTSERIIAAEESGTEFVASHPELAREEPDYDPCLEEGICPDDDDDFDEYDPEEESEESTLQLECPDTEIETEEED